MDKMNASRYSRQCMLPEFADKQELLANKRVAIAGLGGLGGLCSYLLVGAGILKLNIADSDVVELSNIHRQILFNQHNVGTSKLDCTISELKSLDERVQINSFAYVDEFNFNEFSQDCDLVLDLTDNLESRRKLSRLCCQNAIDLVHTSVAAFNGIMMALPYSNMEFLQKYGCYECMVGQDQSLSTQGITGPAAAMMASACAQLVLLLLTDNYQEVGTVYLYDLKNFNIKRARLSPDENCPVCGGFHANYI